MEKEEAWQRHLTRIERLKHADDFAAESNAIFSELIADGYPRELAIRIVKEARAMSGRMIK